MGCATTIKKKCSNARGCSTENNLALTLEMIAEGVVVLFFDLQEVKPDTDQVFQTGELRTRTKPALWPQSVI